MALEPIGKTVIQVGLDDTKVTDGLTKLNAKMKMADNAWKSSLSTFKQSDRSIEKLGVSLKGMNDKLKVQQTVVAAHEKKVEKLAAEYGNTHTKVIKATAELEKQRATMGNLQRSVGEVTKELQDLQKAEQLSKSPWAQRQKELQAYSDKMTAIGDKAMGMGQNMSMTVTAPIAAGFGAAIKKSMDFEAQMSRVGAIANSSKSDLKAMTDQAMELGAQTSKSASEVAKGFEEMVAMGFSAKETMAAMPGVIAASEASGADMAQTAKVMASTMNAFGLEASKSTHVADVLAQTANQSAADITDMEYALKYAAAPAKALGMSLEETSAGIGMMVDAGLKGEQAGTTLRGALLGLLDPSEENYKLMKKMGIEITDSQGNFVGLSQLITNLDESMEGMTKTQKAANLSQLVGKEAVSGMLVLMENGAPKIDKMTKSLEKSDGASASAAKKMKNNLKGAVEELGGAFETVGLQVGKDLTPMLQSLAKGITVAANKFSELNPGVRKTIVGLGLVAAAAGPSLIAFGMMAKGVGAVAGAFSKLSGPLKLFTKSGREASTVFKVGAKAVDVFKVGIGKLPSVFGVAKKAVGGLTTGFKLLRLAVVTNPFGAILLGVTALGTGLVWLYKHNEKFRNAVNNMAKGTKKIFGDMVNWAKDIGAKFGAGFGKAVDSVKKFGADVGKKFGEVKTGAIKKFQEMHLGIGKWTSETGKNLSSKWSSIKKNTTVITGAIKNSSIKKYEELKSGTIKSLGLAATGLSKKWSDIKKNTSSSTEGIRKTAVKKYEDLKSGTVKWLGVASTQMSNKWGIIKKNTTSLSESVRKVAVDKFEQMYKKTTDWVTKIGTFISGAKAGISRKAGDLGKGVANAAIGGLNAMIGGINSISKGITGKGNLISKIPALSTGSGIKKDTLAIVGDKGPGNGPGGFTQEIIKRKDGSMHLTPGQDTLVQLNRGDKVINGRDTHKLMKEGHIPRFSKGLGTDLFAKGIIGGFNKANDVLGPEKTIKTTKKVAKTVDKVKDFGEEIFEYMDNPGKLIEMVIGPIKNKFSNIGGATGKIALGAFNNIKSKLVGTVKGWFDEFGGNANGGEILGFPKTTPYSPNAVPKGYPFNAFHYGIDLRTPAGTLLHAPTSGVLSQTSDYNGGLTAILKDKIYTQFFMHLSKVLKTGPVKQGDPIVRTGNSGHMTTGPHLHYQVRKNDGTNNWNTNTIDPEKFLNSKAPSSRDTGGGSQGNWRPTVLKALAMSGLPTSAPYVNAWLRQIQTESGGRPTVIGGDDGLADGKAMGLVQVKPGTFRANMLPGHGNILNPLDNLIAGMRYAKTRYGGSLLRVIGQGHGYANGGIITKRHFAEVGEEGEEVIIPMNKKRRPRAQQLLAYANGVINKDGRKHVKEPPKTHTVKSGDTLWGIAQANKMTVSMLKQLNNLKSNLIFPKQVLKLNDTAKKLVKGISEHASAIKQSITKKQTTVKPKVQMTSVTGVISKFADSLIRSGTIFKDLKTSRTDLSFGKFLESKLKGLNSSNIKTVMKNVSDIKKKLTDIDKKNDKLIKTNNTKIKSATVKNFDEQLKIDNYKAEKALNGKKGTITVKSRIAARDTTMIDRKLAKSKINKASHEKDIKTLEAARKKLKSKKDLAANKKRIDAEKKQLAQEIANIKKYEAQRADALKLKYKTEKKYVTGRSASTLDKLINTSTNKIGKNSTLIKNLKSENALYNKQSATLNKIKGAEILKSDVLKKIASRREQLVKMMEALKKKETSLKEEKQGFADSISENLQSYAGFGGARGHTARDFVSWMRYRLGKMRTFASNIQKLKGMGLDPKLIREMLAGGIENAMPKVEALLKGGGGYISQINSLQKEIDGVVKSISTEQSSSLFADELADNKRRQGNVTKAMKANESKLNDFRNSKDKVVSMKSYTDLENKTSKYKYQAKPLPKKTTTKKTTTTSGKYKVKSGDSLWLIANKYKTTIDNLKKLNGLKSNLIHPNQTLKVPGAAKSQKVVNLEAAKKKREDESTRLIVNTAKKLNVVGKNDKYAAQLQKEIADIRKTTTKKDDALVAKLEKEMKENKALTKEMVNLLSQILNKPTNVILDGQKVSKTVEKNIVTKAKTTARKTVTPKPKTPVRRKA